MHKVAHLKNYKDYLTIICSLDENSIEKVIQFDADILNLVNNEGDTIFHSLWMYRKRKLFKKLFLKFSQEINFNHLNHQHLNTLLLTSYLNDTEILELLLTCPKGKNVGEIDLYQTNEKGYSSLDLATVKKECLSLEVLLRKGFNQTCDKLHIQKALTFANKHGNLLAISLLEKHFFSISLKNLEDNIQITKI